ncbi:hypothetical protein ACQU0X_08495 [Pseudovibrio ascidiaceicola]|uniref:hypothetical protein n=1 Tax=Pseudovibrio ascidiaceicola TaxID=285279 RepID=UPI003D35C5F4
MQMITPTSELEAVNTLLRAISESPVSSLSGDVGVDVVTARATLAEINKAVQTEGWLFNTEDDYPLPRDRDGYVHAPLNALSVAVPKNRGSSIDPVLRGQRLYDRKNHTYEFAHDLAATIIFGLPFEELPESARHYVTYRAARKFQDNNIGTDAMHRFSERDELTARFRFTDEQAADEDLNFLRDSPDMAGLVAL